MGRNRQGSSQGPPHQTEQSVPHELFLELIRELARKAAREDHERAERGRKDPRKRVLKPMKPRRSTS